MLNIPSDRPCISIVTPCLNGRSFIEEAIQSVLKQEYTNIEHIVVDGGSSDGTLDVLAKYSHLKVVSEPDQGLYDALNKGIRLSRGEIVGHLNCDDLYAEHAFERVAETFVDHPAFDAVCGGVQVFESGEAGAGRVVAQHMSLNDVALSIENATTGPALTNGRFFRKRVYENVGFYEPRFRIAADREFLIRAASAGVQSLGMPVVLYHYRIHPGSLTFSRRSPNRSRMLNEFLEIAENYIGKQDGSEAAESYCRKWHARTAAEAVLRSLRERNYVSALKYARRGRAHQPSWPLTFMTVIIRRMITGTSH